MRKSKALTIILIVIISVITVSACSKADNDQRLRDEGRFSVTFDCMGGLIGNYSKGYQFAFPDSLLLAPGKNAEFKDAILAGHSIDGWYLGEDDGFGRVTYGKKWNFDTDRMPGHDIILYAKWTPLPSFVIYYGESFSERETYYVLAGGKMNENFTPPAWKEHTLLGYYKDKECTQPFDFDVPHNAVTGSKQVPIYTKWLEGEYVLVRTGADLEKIYATTNFYFLDNVDFDGYKWTMPDNFSGKIIGNNRTLSNVNFEIEQTGQTTFGLFGVLNAAEFKDLTFDKCTVTVRIAASKAANIGFFAGIVNANTTFTNINVYKSSVTYTSTATGASVSIGKISGNTLSDSVKLVNCDFEGLDAVKPD